MSKAAKIRTKNYIPWNKGKNISNEVKSKISNTLKSRYALGKISIPKKDRYKKDRSLSKETRVKISKSKKGKIWVNNLITNKLILPEDLDIYLQNGWSKGRNTQKY